MRGIVNEPQAIVIICSIKYNWPKTWVFLVRLADTKWLQHMDQCPSLGNLQQDCTAHMAAMRCKHMVGDVGFETDAHARILQSDLCTTEHRANVEIPGPVRLSWLHCAYINFLLC